MRAAPPSQDRTESGPPNLFENDSRRWLLFGCWQPKLIIAAHKRRADNRHRDNLADLLLADHHRRMSVDRGLVNVEDHVAVRDCHGLAAHCSRSVATH